MGVWHVRERGGVSKRVDPVLATMFMKLERVQLQSLKFTLVEQVQGCLEGEGGVLVTVAEQHAVLCLHA